MKLKTNNLPDAFNLVGLWPTEKDEEIKDSLDKAGYEFYWEDEYPNGLRRMFFAEKGKAAGGITTIKYEELYGN